jgi:hypothetical protein
MALHHPCSGWNEDAVRSALEGKIKAGDRNCTPHSGGHDAGRPKAGAETGMATTIRRHDDAANSYDRPHNAQSQR